MEQAPEPHRIGTDRDRQHVAVAVDDDAARPIVRHPIAHKPSVAVRADASCDGIAAVWAAGVGAP